MSTAGLDPVNIWHILVKSSNDILNLIFLRTEHFTLNFRFADNLSIFIVSQVNDVDRRGTWVTCRGLSCILFFRKWKTNLFVVIVNEIGPTYIYLYSVSQKKLPFRPY